jgi:hypothetical protein
MNTKYLFFTSLSIAFLLIFGCNQATESPSTPAPVQNTAPTRQITPPLAMAALQYIHQNSDQIDYVFDNLPFSTNASGPNVQKSVNMFNEQPVMNQGCAQKMGTANFTGKGQLIASANFFVSPGCNYWLINFRNVTYANQMTQEAMNYFKQVSTRVTTTTE